MAEKFKKFTKAFMSCLHIVLALAVLWSGVPLAHSSMSQGSHGKSHMVDAVSDAHHAHSTSHEHHSSATEASHKVTSDFDGLQKNTADGHCASFCTFAAFSPQASLFVHDVSYTSYDAKLVLALNERTPSLIKRPPKA
jgi:hypothetical protein